MLSAMATASAAVATSVSPGYRTSMRNPSLKSSEETRSERMRTMSLFIIEWLPLSATTFRPEPSSRDMIRLPALTARKPNGCSNSARSISPD
jgi:hypothetical protein